MKDVSTDSKDSRNSYLSDYKGFEGELSLTFTEDESTLSMNGEETDYDSGGKILESREYHKSYAKPYEIVFKNRKAYVYRDPEHLQDYLPLTFKGSEITCITYDYHLWSDETFKFE